MDIFEYLPQLIVAYDGNDEFANLIHVKKANKDIDYFCPCCGGIVKPRALDSTKEQSHYYHITGKCTKESQLHFFCKNWLFEKGSKFYLEDILYEVDFIDIEKIWNTPFGDYKPDISVYTTSGEIIYFEMFFTNRKTGDDYFCKWDYLKNDVAEVDIKEYVFKTDENIIPSFKYLFHDRVCFSKPYIKRDLYANTIARIKHELTRQKVLNYKARIEQLDWFWQEIKNSKSREEILNTITNMEYDDMISCYEIIKRKQCISYLKNDILNIINQKVISDVREKLQLSNDDEDVYFDLEHIRGRTYVVGIRLVLKTSHITYNKIYVSYNDYFYDYKNLKSFPKIVFSKNILDINELIIPENKINDLNEIYDYVLKLKEKLLNYENELSVFEGDRYKIKVQNDLHTVLIRTDNNDYEVVFENYRIKDFDINQLSKDIQYKIKEIKDKTYMDIILKDEDHQAEICALKNYTKDIDYDINIEYNGYHYENNGIYFELYFHHKCVYNQMMQPTVEDFNNKINDCKKIIDDFIQANSIVIDLIKKINDCKNEFWNAELSFDYNGYPEIKIDQRLFKVKKYYLSTYERIYLDDLETLSKKEIKKRIKKAMLDVLKNIEKCGYRVMEVRNEE